MTRRVIHPPQPVVTRHATCQNIPHQHVLFGIVIYMKRILVASLIFSVFFTGTYWFYTDASMCRYPIAYSIGEFDERFSITEAEARVAIHDAETVWEEAVGEHLFTYDENAAFTINFVFDDRQALSDEQRADRSELEELQAENVAVSNRHTELVEEHRERQATHRAEVAEYEARLQAHNETVEAYNEAGGASPEEFRELEAERAALATEAERLDATISSLNALASEINELSEEGNRLIEQYNQQVAAYNERYGQSREFTQGDYQGDRINIYTFADQLELRQVLAHELGHALALEHVDDPEAIMYYLMGTQPDELTLTEADVAEFDRVCGDGPTLRGFISHLLYR